MLSFLNPLFLLTLPLAALPIIINLIRPRVKLQFEWPSLFLLRRAEKKRARRRIRLIEIILIALRVLIIASGILLLARPYVFSGGGGQADTIIILDDSFSMGYLDAGERRLSQTKESITAMLEGMDNSDRVALIKGSEPYEAEWETPAEVRREIAAAVPCYGTGLGLTVVSALNLAEDTDNRIEIHIFTDCQRNGFSDWPNEITGSVKTYVHDVREEPGPFHNLALTGYDIPAVSPDEAVVRISGFGDVTPARLEWENGDAPVGKGELDFAKVPLNTAETTTVTINDNSFAFDNTLEMPVYYPEPIPYYISPEIDGPYFDAALWSLGAYAVRDLPSSFPALAASRFGVIPEGAQGFIESGGLLLLAVSPGDKGEAWGLRVESGAEISVPSGMVFLPPLYDSSDIGGPFIGELRKADYDANWRIATETTGNEPAILYRKIGEGEVWVVLVPTGPGAEFPLHPSFVSFMGDLLGRTREIATGTPLQTDVKSAESEVDFLGETEFAEEFPEVTYIGGERDVKAGWSLDLTVPVFVFLILLLTVEPFLAAYVTRKTR